MPVPVRHHHHRSSVCLFHGVVVVLLIRIYHLVVHGHYNKQNSSRNGGIEMLEHGNDCSREARTVAAVTKPLLAVLVKQWQFAERDGGAENIWVRCVMNV